MRFFVRIMVSVATGLTVAIGVFSFAGSWFGDESNPLQLSRWIVFETRRTEALRHRSDSVAHMCEIKQSTITELVAGRMHLREAIVQFQMANDRVEKGDRDVVAEYVTPTDPEGVGRQVLAWVRNEVSVWPASKAQRTVAEIEKQFQEMFNHPSSPPPSAAEL